MDNLKAENFFELSNFKHAAIFTNCEYVWNALAKIHAYISAYPSGNIEANIPVGAHIIDPTTIRIGKGSIIEPGAYIKGPCIIGENCTIRHGAYIRGDLITGNNCIIGHDTEIKNVIMLDGAHAAHFAYVGDSILGNHVNLGAGVKCANLKFDKSVLTVTWNSFTINTGLRKFGAILGDNAQLGCNSVTNPGTIIGKNSAIYPCVNFGGILLSNHLVKNSSNSRVVPMHQVQSKS